MTSEIIEIYLNSKSADQYYDNMISNALFSLPIIEIRKDETAYISVKNCVIPRSFYNVNNSNNMLNYSVDGIDYTINLTNGNYNVLNLKSHIVELFNSSGYTMIITYDTKTNKLTFRGTVHEFTFKQSSNCFELIGLLENYDYVSNNLELKSNIGTNLFTIKNIYLTSSNFILNNIDSNNHNKSSILASIPVKGVENSILFYEDRTKHLIHNCNNLTALRIILTDENSNLIDFNGIHYSITLELTIIG
tara:strand:+ start:1662 stop:2405 length:744 start_codon:yes stop_codon:yes gene_type:complete